MTTVGEGGEDFCVLIYVKHSTNQKTVSNTGYGTDYLHICFSMITIDYFVKLRQNLMIKVLCHKNIIVGT